MQASCSSPCNSLIPPESQLRDGALRGRIHELIAGCRSFSQGPLMEVRLRIEMRRWHRRTNATMFTAHFLSGSDTAHGQRARFGSLMIARG